MANGATQCGKGRPEYRSLTVTAGENSVRAVKSRVKWSDRRVDTDGRLSCWRRLAVSDVVRVICPNLRCRAILLVPASARGKTVRCRQCSTRVRIPLAPPVAAPQPQETEAVTEQTDEVEEEQQ